MLTDQKLVSFITEVVRNVIVELLGSTSDKRMVEVTHIDNEELLSQGEMGLREVKEFVNQKIYRRTPWAAKRSGIVYPDKGRLVTLDLGRFRIENGCLWKEDEEPPPSEEGDLVERGLGHSQRVESSNGHTILKASGFTIDVRTQTSESDDRAAKLANDGEVVIEGRSGAKVIVDSLGDIKIVGGNVYLGSENTTPVFQGVLRNKDVSKKPVIPGVPAFMQIIDPPATAGSSKVGAAD